MELHKLGVKFFVADANGVGLLEFIPIFHRWIQTRVLDDLLIDVADYSHVYAGPGILLVAHEGNYSVDETGNRRGLAYYSKHPLDGDLSERLTTVCRKALKACRLLVQEVELKDRLKFQGEALQVFANDRLVAPNTEETWLAFAPALKALLARLYLGADYELTREVDSKERFSVTIKVGKPVEIDTLLERLSEQEPSDYSRQ
jgi:hypothetical protein